MPCRERKIPVARHHCYSEIFELSGNYWCHTRENYIIFVYIIFVKFPDTLRKFVPIWKLSKTCPKFSDKHIKFQPPEICVYQDKKQHNLYVQSKFSDTCCIFPDTRREMFFQSEGGGGGLWLNKKNSFFGLKTLCFMGGG